ncbi:MAG: cupredoxin family copper-binding protein [Gemmatimonadaceae bacterium]
MLCHTRVTPHLSAFGSIFAATLLLGTSCTRTGASAHSVEMRAFQYQPASLTVQFGDTVTWINDDLVPHTATAGAKRFDSGSVDARGSWRYVAERKGTFSYECTFHPMMKGTLIVR